MITSRSFLRLGLYSPRSSRFDEILGDLDITPPLGLKETGSSGSCVEHVTDVNIPKEQLKMIAKRINSNLDGINFECFIMLNMKPSALEIAFVNAPRQEIRHINFLNDVFITFF